MEFIAFTSKDKDLYTQSVNLRNNYLYRSAGMPELSLEGKEIEKNNYFFGGVENGELLATVSFYHITENHLQLVAMAVSSACQGKGTGTQLVNFAIEYFKNKIKDKFIITTNGRKAAFNFYCRLGFEPVGEEVADKSHGGTVHIPMRKTVDK